MSFFFLRSLHQDHDFPSMYSATVTLNYGRSDYTLILQDSNMAALIRYSMSLYNLAILQGNHIGCPLSPEFNLQFT